MGIYVNGPALTHTLAYTRRRWCTPAVRRRRCPRHTGGRAGKPDKQIATNCSVSLAYPQHWPPPHRLRIHGATRRWRIHPYLTASSSDSGACKIGWSQGAHLVDVGLPLPHTDSRTVYSVGILMFNGCLVSFLALIYSLVLCGRLSK